MIAGNQCVRSALRKNQQVSRGDKQLSGASNGCRGKPQGTSSRLNCCLLPLRHASPHHSVISEKTSYFWVANLLKFRPKYSWCNLKLGSSQVLQPSLITSKERDSVLQLFISTFELLRGAHLIGSSHCDRLMEIRAYIRGEGIYSISSHQTPLLIPHSAARWYCINCLSHPPF